MGHSRREGSLWYVHGLLLLTDSRTTYIHMMLYLAPTGALYVMLPYYEILSIYANIHKFSF